MLEFISILALFSKTDPITKSKMLIHIFNFNKSPFLKEEEILFLVEKSITIFSKAINYKRSFLFNKYLEIKVKDFSLFEIRIKYLAKKFIQF